MTAIGATPPTATRAEPTDMMIGNFVVNGVVTTDIDMTGLRRSNASYEIESINNDINLKTNNIVGAKLAQNGDFSVHTNGIFYDKSSGFTGFGTASAAARLHSQKDGDFSVLFDESDAAILLKSSSGSAQSLRMGVDNTLKVSVLQSVEFGVSNNTLAFNPFGGNIGIGTTDQFGSGDGVVGMANGTAPTGTPTGGGIYYVEAGAFKFKGSSGTVTVLGVA